MSFIPKNPITIPEIIDAPPAPSSNLRGLFAKSDGWYEIDSSGIERKLARDIDVGRSATYYIGASDTPNNIGCNYICNNTEGNRLNDIIGKIMTEIQKDTKLQGSKIIVRNGTYCQSGAINITQKCVMDFEDEFDITTEGENDWVISASNCVFENFKSYGVFYIWGDSNTFRFCSFNQDVQVGNPSILNETLINGNRNSFIGCKFVDSGLLLAGEENVVKNCHFTSTDLTSYSVECNIKYNGQFPGRFTAYFYGNSSEFGTEIPLYDTTTIQFADQMPMVSIDEFNTLTKNGLYLIYEGNCLFLGIIHTETFRYYTIINPANFNIVTRTTYVEDNSVLEDYTNKFCAYGDIDGNNISGTYQRQHSDSLITNAKSIVDAINEVAEKCIQSVTIKGGTNNWKKEEVKDASGAIAGYRYGQVVTVQNATITEHSKVDLQPSSEQIVIFGKKSLAFTAENDSGVITVYCANLIPEEDYTMQVTVTEVVIHG